MNHKEYVAVKTVLKELCRSRKVAKVIISFNSWDAGLTSQMKLEVVRKKWWQIL